jgi:hypothetical protein
MTGKSKIRATAKQQQKQRQNAGVLPLRQAQGQDDNLKTRAEAMLVGWLVSYSTGSLAL